MDETITTTVVTTTTITREDEDPPSGRLKTERIAIRVSPAEYEQIAKAAEADNRTMSQYALLALLAASTPKYKKR